MSPLAQLREWQQIKQLQAQAADAAAGQQAAVDARRFDIAAAEIERLQAWQAAAKTLAMQLMPDACSESLTAEQWLSALTSILQGQSAQVVEDPARAEFERFAHESGLDLARAATDPDRYAAYPTQMAWQVCAQRAMRTH